MAFIRVIPRYRYDPNDIKVSFMFDKSKDAVANVYISNDLMNYLGWEKDDRFNIYYNDKRHKQWMIEKTDENKDSFKLYDIESKSRKYFKLNFRYRGNINNYDKKIKGVDFYIKYGKVVINNSYIPKVSK